jgi:hypothetical protein
VQDPALRKLIRNFAIEMVVYGVLVVGYFFVALRFLDRPLQQLFVSNLTLYAVAALVLVVVQAVFLDLVTSSIMRWLGLDKLE